MEHLTTHKVNPEPDPTLQGIQRQILQKVKGSVSFLETHPPQNTLNEVHSTLGSHNSPDLQTHERIHITRWTPAVLPGGLPMLIHFLCMYPKVYNKTNNIF